MALKKLDGRDEFATQDKDVLARRVGMSCSNPGCRQLTSGPQDHPRKALNIGVAAHIAAAAARGPRYDPKMTAEDRANIINAIWLCQNCAKLVDNDPAHFTVELLRRWKHRSEDAARHDVESPGGAEADSGVLSTTECAQILRLDGHTVVTLLESGELRGLTVAGQWRVTTAQVVDFLAERSQATAMEVLARQLSAPEGWARELRRCPQFMEQIQQADYDEGTFGRFLQDTLVCSK